MVAKITTPSRILAALNYNENKVKLGKAKCIHANGFLQELKDLSFTQKLNGFERLNQRNERAKTKTLHISLNFDPSEKISIGKLNSIADAYIKGIGFDNQPYLVYQHHDAGHPHIHIVTTTIREDGSRINTHNIGRNQSEKTRKELEVSFNLVKASDKQRQSIQQLTPVNSKMLYGKTETRNAINCAVNNVLKNYLFCSLPEFNAILQQFNIIADRGSEDSRMYKNRGLHYRILDSAGNKMGVPIKASLLSENPGLKNLEKVFEKNKELIDRFKQPLRQTIDEVLSKNPGSLNELVERLTQKDILTVLRKSVDGRVYGITFVDQRNKTVFNGSDIGKAYSAAHLQNRLAKIATKSIKRVPAHADDQPLPEIKENLIELLLQPEQEFNVQPGGLIKKKRKRKRKYLGL